MSKRRKDPRADTRRSKKYEHERIENPRKNIVSHLLNT